jgi:hypothetical protein
MARKRTEVLWLFQSMWCERGINVMMFLRFQFQPTRGTDANDAREPGRAKTNETIK